jgi:hypothetical protein
MRVSLFVAAVAATAASALAQTPVGPFTGTHQEDFEGGSVIFTPCMPVGVFAGTAQMCTPGHSGCHTTGSWGFQCQIFPQAGTWLFGSADGYVEYAFSTPAYQFGGYFGINSGFADATVTFYDGLGNVIGSPQIASIPADCQWHWNGWSIPGGAAKVEIVGNSYNQGAFVMMDSMEVDYNPSGPTPPVVYCSSGTTTNGCVAAISASANPNVAHSNTCQITVANVEGQKSGILFYGLASNASPWCSIGGTSFLCVKAPTQRTVAQPSGGTAGLCDGTLALDWNAWQLGNPGALGQPFAAGSQAFVQGWFRDPPACKTTNMSDALELTYQP